MLGLASWFSMRGFKTISNKNIKVGQWENIDLSCISCRLNSSMGKGGGLTELLLHPPMDLKVGLNLCCLFELLTDGSIKQYICVILVWYFRQFHLNQRV
jgi:hypothetical protein